MGAKKRSFVPKFQLELCRLLARASLDFYLSFNSASRQIQLAICPFCYWTIDQLTVEVILICCAGIEACILAIW